MDTRSIQDQTAKSGHGFGFTVALSFGQTSFLIFAILAQTAIASGALAVGSQYSVYLACVLPILLIYIIIRGFVFASQDHQRFSNLVSSNIELNALAAKELKRIKARQENDHNGSDTT